MRVDAAICLQVPCFTSYPSKVEEPDEVVSNDERTRREECRGGEGDEGPSAGEVLEINDMATERKHCLQ